MEYCRQDFCVSSLNTAPEWCSKGIHYFFIYKRGGKRWTVFSLLIRCKYNSNNSNEKLSSELLPFLQEFKFWTKSVKTFFLQVSFMTKNIPVVHDGNCSLRHSPTFLRSEKYCQVLSSTFSGWVKLTVPCSSWWYWFGVAALSWQQQPQGLVLVAAIRADTSPALIILVWEM